MNRGDVPANIPPSGPSFQHVEATVYSALGVYTLGVHAPIDHAPGAIPITHL